MKTANNSRIRRTIPSVLIVGLLCSSAYGKTIYVDDDSMGANDGTSWEDAYSFLQDALADANSAAKPVEIRVARGVYTPDSNSAMPDGTGDEEATFRLINGVTLRGGYAGIAEPDPDARDVAAYETILSGDLNGADVDRPIDSDEEPTREENGYQVVTGSSTDQTAVLDGFTITGGNASGPILGDESSWDNRLRRGGGKYNYEGSPTLKNCTFCRNSVHLDGGGMYNYQSSPTLTNCILWDNTSFFMDNTYSSIGGDAIVSYSNIEGGFPGEGNIDADPLFAALGYWHDNNTPDDPEDDYWVDGDYHLKSQAGRFDQTTQTWVKDDVTSPCIDAGDPLSAVMYEPHPRGCIINMGAYGGTEEASKSPFGCSYEADGE